MREERITTGRRARYYTLGGDGGATSAWIVCHGFGQLGVRFAADFAPVASPTRLIVVPEALNRFYLTTASDGSHGDARVGATWMTREDREAEIADYVDYLEAVRAATVAEDVPLTALGFSQGVATVCRWVALGARPVQRLILWAGQIPPDVDLAAIAGRVAEPLIVVHGTKDEHAQWMQMEAMHERLATAGVRAEIRTFEGGHRMDRGVLGALAPG
ncbi:MAG: dienelactone hydrolase family protein [Gemmatimonadaceae bacterium]